MGANLKKILSIALTLTLCFGMVACSTKGGKSSMGRYVEEKYELPEGVEVQNLSLLENDKIGMIGYSTDDFVPVFFISEKHGQKMILSYLRKKEKKHILIVLDI